MTATDIVQLIGATVALKRSGRNFLGLCPFHQEKSPSFNVNPERQAFYCFGCKAKGNAIDFVMQRDRIEFLDALKLLGQQAGLEMPRFGVSREKTGEKQALLDMQSAACAFFEKMLQSLAGEAARDYLDKRRIDLDSIRRFRIGFAPDAWDGLLRSDVARKFRPADLATGGLLKPRQTGEGFYDTFRNRLMFPIRDDNGRVIAFGGRKMPDSQDPAKYLNSPETPLFSKSKSLFGIDLAKQKMVETRTAVVVEGYTDVIVAHQFGVSQVVAVLGTGMTEQHVMLLRRFADRIVLMFDADSAGDSAVDRAVGLFLTQPVEILIASMPEGVDPDEFLLEHGAEAFQKIVDGASDALSYKWKQLVRNYNESGGDLTGQQKAVEHYMELLAQARGSGPVDALRWGAALARVSRLTDIPVDELNRRFRTAPKRPGPTKAPAEAPPVPAPQPRGPLSAREKAERWILGALLIEPHRWNDVQMKIGPGDFRDAGNRALAEVYWAHQRDEGEPVFNEFLGQLNLRDPVLADVAMLAVDEVERLAGIDGDLTAVVDRSLVEALGHFDENRRLAEERKLVAEIRRTSDERTSGSELELLKDLQEKVRRPDLRRL